MKVELFNPDPPPQGEWILRLLPWLLGGLVFCGIAFGIYRFWEPIVNVFNQGRTQLAAITEFVPDVPDPLEPEVVATFTATATATPDIVSTPTFTPTPTATFTPSVTPTPTATPTVTPVPEPEAGTRLVWGIDDAPLRYIAGGFFLFGSTPDDPGALDNEFPRYELELPAFWIDETEVTNARYAACVALGQCTEPKDLTGPLNIDYYTVEDFADHPVLNVTWEQANAYCTWAGRRLPTEQEWEKAARGEIGLYYPWGNGAAISDVANFRLFKENTMPVNSYPDGVSVYGVADLAGNVAEWTDSYYRTHYNSLLADLTATPEPSTLYRGGVHVIRNGAWNDTDETRMRAAYRYAAPSQTYFSSTVGFRCARTP